MKKVNFIAVILTFAFVWNLSSCETKEKTTLSNEPAVTEVESTLQPAQLAENFNVLIVARSEFTNLPNTKPIIFCYTFDSEKNFVLRGQQKSSNGKFEGAKISVNFLLPTTIQFTSGVPLSNLILRHQDVQKIQNLPTTVLSLIFNPKQLQGDSGIVYTVYPSPSTTISSFAPKDYTALFDINPSPPKNYNTGE